MSQQLTDMQITRVSLVDKGANLRRFAVLKRDEEGPMAQLAGAPADSTPAGFAAFLRKAADAILGTRDSIAKAMTFAEIVAGQELNDALYDSYSTLQDALWSAIYAYDDDGKPLSIEAKTELVGKNLDEYKTYLLAAMASGVEKSAGSPAEAPSRHIAAIVAKVGRKISGSRLERLQQAADSLSSVLAEVAEASTEADDAEEEPVEKAELVEAVAEAITKAQAPLIERLEKLESPKVVVKVDAPEGGAGDDDAPATLETVVEVVGKLADRLDAIEKRSSAGGRTSIAGQDGQGDVKKRSAFAGLL